MLSTLTVKVNSMSVSPIFIHHTISDALQVGPLAMATRACYRPGSSYCPHDHECPEVFWIEEGSAIHIQGTEREQLDAGALVFIRPQDVHAFATPPEEGFTIVNVCLAPAVVERLCADYASCIAAWPWPSVAHVPRPFHHHLDQHGLNALQPWADAVGRAADRVAVDGLLLTLLRLISAPVADGDEIPPWLRQAVITFGDPDHLASGSEGLAHLAGRGMAHLNRSVRRHYGVTATELVNKLRLEHASRRLGMSNDAIVDIAMESGFDSLSYFYRIFRRVYGVTPQRYRIQHRALPPTGWT